MLLRYRPPVCGGRLIQLATLRLNWFLWARMGPGCGRGQVGSSLRYGLRLHLFSGEEVTSVPLMFAVTSVPLRHHALPWTAQKTDVLMLCGRINTKPRRLCCGDRCDCNSLSPRQVSIASTCSGNPRSLHSVRDTLC